MNAYYLSIGKRIIEFGDVIEFKELVDDYLQTINNKEYHFSEILFKDLFIHACLKGKLEIVQELYMIYTKFNDIDKIGLSPTFLYCKYICKDQNVKNFLNGL